MTAALCSAPECDRPASTVGLCQAHYHRMRRNGHLLDANGNIELTCSKTTHGRRDSPEYKSWIEMRRRCRGRQGKMEYVERGIKVCQRWDESFEAFFADMGPRPEGMTLDRHPDPNGNYEPGNCRWATAVEQARNKTCTLTVEVGGECIALAEYCERLGLKRKLISDRITRLGWTLDRAISEPDPIKTSRAGHAPAERAA